MSRRKQQKMSARFTAPPLVRAIRPVRRAFHSLSVAAEAAAGAFTKAFGR